MSAGYRRTGEGELRLNWSHAKLSDSPKPCVICGNGAHLRHPITESPMHKTCHDQRAAAEQAATEQRLTRRAATNRSRTGT